ncbi:MAG: DUF1080 domain-containing protein [Ignavibacteriae bacterium]|nr:DUF1080 domain-containing protein [Ignavibacteriota bacterium]
MKPQNHKKFLSYIQILALVFFISNLLFAQEEGNPKLTEVWDPVPPIITPGEKNCMPPSDAIVLFDGTNLDEWENVKGGEAKWLLGDGAMTAVKKTGSIKTKKVFGDCQLHIEWRTPEKVEGDGQGRGNSGIFLQDRYEVQVLDSYNNVTYSNGQAASIYKQHIPLVNVCKRPGEWQTYDIFYNAPIFKDNGDVEKPAYITVVQNGVLVQNHVEIKGTTVYIGQPKYEKHNAKEPISLQDHGNPTSYRNIWIREL